MRGALEFWRFFFGMIGGALLLGVPMGAGALAGWLIAGGTGAMVGFGVGGAAVLVGVPTWATWKKGGSDHA